MNKLFVKVLALFLIASTFSFDTLAKPGQPGNIKKTQAHSLGLGLGQTFLLQEFDDHGEDKITLDLLYEYAASYSFDLLVNAHFSSQDFDSEEVQLMGLATSIKSRLFEFDAFSPYILAGLGFYAPKLKRRVNGNIVESQRKVTFGLNFGGGADLRLNSKYTAGFLAQFHKPFKIKQENQESVRGSYLKLLITLMRTF